MKETENRGRVPRLRFPEFLESGEWIAKSLKNACEVNPANSELPEQFVYIDLESVEAGELKARKIINRDEAPSRAQRLLRYGDVIFQIVRPYQRNNLHFKIDEDIRYVASTGYAQLRASDSEDFLFQAIHTDDFVERVIAKCTGSSYPAINSSDLADIPIAIPGKVEQQKIGDCLSSLDDLITLEAQKLGALKTHKKGLMQQLFPAEGETVPRLRFPEFREADWDEISLNEVGTFTGGGTPSTKKRDYWTGENPWISSSDLSEESIFSINITRHISDKAIVDSATKVVPENSVLIVSRVGIGKVAITRKAVCTSQDFTSLTPKNDDPVFLGFYLKTLVHVFLSLNQGMAIKGFTKDDISKLKIFRPSRCEQIKIADCLSSLDDLITFEAQKLDALKTHKKGLMQQIFPALDEVQG
jgi:type I restriction enzyme S subunit